jgi:hypothetical protein
MSTPSNPPPPLPPHREAEGANETLFREKMNDFLDWMYDYFTNSFSNILSWMNETMEAVFGKSEEVATNAQTVADMRGEVEGMRDQISSMKNDIENFAIPEETTYTVEELDEISASIYCELHTLTANQQRILIEGVN